MISYEDVPGNIRHIVSVTQLRRHLAHYIAMVRYGDDWVCIKRRGMPPVFLVSQADFDLICTRRDDLHGGPPDAAGHRTGFGLVYWLKALIRAERSGDPGAVGEVEFAMEATRFGEDASSP